MSQYEFKNCQIGAAGENAVSENATFIMNSLEKDNIDLDDLIVEVNKIIESLKSKENKTDEEYELLGNIVGICKNKKKEDVVSKIIQNSSKLLLNLSLGVGGGIIANIISSGVGL